MLTLVFVTFVDIFVPVYCVILLVRVVLSYLLRPENGFLEWLTGITEPLLAPVRRIFPPAAGIDFAPLVVLLLLQGLQTLVDGFIHL